MKKLILGVELGSTRIKSVLTDEKGSVLASGSHIWENSFDNGFWTYSLEDIKSGLRESYKMLVSDYGKPITRLDAIGISAMMHGYLAFDRDWNLLVPFRTWRNTNTAEAAEKLTDKLDFHFPERWSASHYYQAVLNGEEHIKKVAHLTTLAGYVHFLLTGKNVLGIGDASGMFPVSGASYDKGLIEKFNLLIPADFAKLLPEVLSAGENAGILTDEGARFVDPTGVLQGGAVLCPPEGDAGTGMVATDSISPRTANVSAGTSAFLMAVLEKPLKKVYKEIDIVTTPTGLPVAMVHVNNCTSEINAWVGLFEEAVKLSGSDMCRATLFESLFKISETADDNAENLTTYNFLSGEPIAGLIEGRPLIFRQPEGKLSLASFMRAQIYSAVATLRLGAEILQHENVLLDSVCAHGGFFKTEGVGQRVMSAALGAPVTVMQNAGEGGAWGIALLAGYSLNNGISLQAYLNGIFKDSERKTVTADDKHRANFNAFMNSYKAGLAVARLASEI